MKELGPPPRPDLPRQVTLEKIPPLGPIVVEVGRLREQQVGAMVRRIFAPNPPVPSLIVFGPDLKVGIELAAIFSARSPKLDVDRLSEGRALAPKPSFLAGIGKALPGHRPDEGSPSIAFEECVRTDHERPRRSLSFEGVEGRGSPSKDAKEGRWRVSFGLVLV
jgi:hypothetical protein